MTDALFCFIIGLGIGFSIGFYIYIPSFGDILEMVEQIDEARRNELKWDFGADDDA